MVYLYFHIFRDQHSLWSPGEFFLCIEKQTLVLSILPLRNMVNLGFFSITAGEYVFCHICLDEYIIFLPHTTTCSCSCTFLWLCLPRVRFWFEELSAYILSMHAIIGDIILLLGLHELSRYARMNHFCMGNYTFHLQKRPFIKISMLLVKKGSQFQLSRLFILLL